MRASITLYWTQRHSTFVPLLQFHKGEFSLCVTCVALYCVSSSFSFLSLTLSHPSVVVCASLFLSASSRSLSKPTPCRQPGPPQSQVWLSPFCKANRRSSFLAAICSTGYLQCVFVFLFLFWHLCGHLGLQSLLFPTHLPRVRLVMRSTREMCQSNFPFIQIRNNVALFITVSNLKTLKLDLN